MKKNIIRISCGLMILLVVTTAAFAQGRGKGFGRGRNADGFDNGRDWRNRPRNNGNGRNQDWKCGKFVNCHDARDGRVDGRGPGVSDYRNRYYRNGYFRDGVFVPQGVRVRNRFEREGFRRSARFDRLESLRRERLAERRYFQNRRRY